MVRARGTVCRTAWPARRCRRRTMGGINRRMSCAELSRPQTVWTSSVERLGTATARVSAEHREQEQQHRDQGRPTGARGRGVRTQSQDQYRETAGQADEQGRSAFGGAYSSRRVHNRASSESAGSRLRIRPALISTRTQRRTCRAVAAGPSSPPQESSKKMGATRLGWRSSATRTSRRRPARAVPNRGRPA